MKAQRYPGLPGQAAGRAASRYGGLVLVLAWAVLGTAPAFAQQSVVKRGEYLARAGDCLSCHTAQGGRPFAGGGRVDTPFGYMLSPNITPDRETGIGNWSREDFYDALHDGVEKNGDDMFPAMPYDFYTKLTRDDVDAIYAYLRTVRPVRNSVEVNHLDFPFSMRWAAGAWRELYFNEGTFRPDPAQSAAWNRGAYLVEGPGHCSDCHSPRNLLGGIDKSKDFSGAMVDGWFAVDLTSDITTGLGSWSKQDIAHYLKTGLAPDSTTAQGPMASIIRGNTSHLTDRDLLAMADYLKSIPPESTLRTGRMPPPPQKRRGAQLYTDHCSGCHKSRGRGVPGVFPPLTGNHDVLASDPANVIQVIDKGIAPAAGAVGMPAFQSVLSDEQVAELANYLRSSWGNDAPQNATPESVAVARAEDNGGKG